MRARVDIFNIKIFREKSAVENNKHIISRSNSVAIESAAGLFQK